MMLGHALLAFSIVSGIAYWRGLETEKILALGVVAGGFAILPDLDMVLSLQALLTLFSTGLDSFVGNFWNISYQFHRGMSHSLVTGLIASSLISVYFYRPERYIGASVILLLSVYAFVLGGIFPAFVMFIFALGGLFIAFYGKEYLNLKEFYSVSLIGLLTHPFGDLFTGSPPEFLFPLAYSLIDSRIILAADPVMNLLLIFSMEVIAVWSAIFAYSRVKDIELRNLVHPVSLIGSIYLLALFTIPKPTLDSPYIFVYSIIGFGVVNSSLVHIYKTNFSREGLVELAVNITLTITVSLIFYSIGYVLIFT